MGKVQQLEKQVLQLIYLWIFTLNIVDQYGSYWTWITILGTYCDFSYGCRCELTLLAIILSGINRGCYTVKMQKIEELIGAKFESDSKYGSSTAGCTG